MPVYSRSGVARAHVLPTIAFLKLTLPPHPNLSKYILLARKCYWSKHIVALCARGRSLARSRPQRRETRQTHTRSSSRDRIDFPAVAAVVLLRHSAEPSHPTRTASIFLYASHKHTYTHTSSLSLADFGTHARAAAVVCCTSCTRYVGRSGRCFTQPTRMLFWV